MGQDPKIQEMTEDLSAGLLGHIIRCNNEFIHRYKVQEDQRARHQEVFCTALRNALAEVRGKYEKLSSRGRKKRFIHLFCGATFATKEEADQHAKEGTCRPSKQTEKARAAQDKILAKRRKKAP